MAQFMPTGAPKDPKAAWALPGFDQDAFDASPAGRNVRAMQEIHRGVPEGGMHPEIVEYWARLGVRKELFDEGTDGEYAVFTPIGMDPERQYPLVYVSHGGGEPIARAETSGFAALVQREQFIAVYPWNGGKSNDAVETEFPRILAALEDAGAPVDPERIYAVGFSAGSDATGVLACAYPDVIAAVSPSPGGNLFAKGRWYESADSYRRNRGSRMPLISVAGTLDGGDRYPLEQPEHVANFDVWMEHIVGVPGYEPVGFDRSVALRGATDPSVAAFGFPFARTFQHRLEGVEWLFGDFVDERGTALARFVTGVGLPHAQTASQAPLIWDFVKHFSRNRTTGESIYAPVVVEAVDTVLAAAPQPTTAS